MHQSAALAAPVSAQAAQTAQKRANPQNVSQERLCLSVNSHETPASEPSWAGASAAACSGSCGSSDSASDWPTPQSERTCSPAWMQSKGQSSQLEEPTAAVLEDVVWHGMLSCSCSYVSIIITIIITILPLCFSIHIISRERSQGLKRKVLSFLNGLKGV